MRLLPVLLILALSPLLAHAAPNVVVILCDDLGYGDVRCYNPERGKITTPRMDRLAAEGMRFTDAHSPSSVCTPTRYSLLTGRYAWRSRLQQGVLLGFGEPLLDDQRPTVAEFLQNQGYATACLGKWHLGLAFGPDRYASPITDGPLRHGFDSFFGISASLDMQPFAWIDGDRFPEPATVTKKFYREGLAARSFEAVDVLPKLTEKAEQYIASRQGQQEPFFLYLPLTAPHTPLVPAPEWRGRSGLGDYGDFVMQVDDTIGRVADAVDRAGLADDTLILVTSDNGFAPAAGTELVESQGHFPSANLRGYKADIWEGGHRVPFIVRWPGVVAAGSRSDQLVGLIDLFATVADVLDEPLPAGAAVDSVSLLPILRGDDRPVRDALVHHSVFGYFAVRRGDWKLNLCRGSGGWAKPNERQAAHRGLPDAQLYDMAADPQESTNLQADHPAVIAEARAYLDHAIATGRTTPGEPQANDAEIVVDKPVN